MNKKKDFMGFDVRVWGNTVFINDKDNVSYVLDVENKMGGLQCNYDEGTPEYEFIFDCCDEIAKNFVKMKELFDKK